MNKIKQHTKRWLKIKSTTIGSGDIASLCQVGFSEPSEIILHKIHGTTDVHDPTTQVLLDHGTRYEPIVRALCSARNNITIIETGLKYHKSHKFITSSPDGYCAGSKADLNAGLKTGQPFLTEFKVRKEISEKIPMKYWIQMQVQMEVWDVSRCLYCENVIKEYPDRFTYEKATINQPDHLHGIIDTSNSKLVTDESVPYRYWSFQGYREQVVERDQMWWNSVIDKICGYWALIEQGRSKKNTRASIKRTAHIADLTPEQEVEKRIKYMDNKIELIQPYQLGNYFRDDPLLDWLELYGPVDKKDDSVNPFMTMMRIKNKDFHQCMVSYIEHQFPDSTYNVSPFDALPQRSRDIGLELHKPQITFENLEKTKLAMSKGIPIIFNPCFSVKLESYKYAIGGRADMIVRNDCLGNVLGCDIANFELDDVMDKYSIVNFRYATINLRADKCHLLNNSKQKVYKAHMWLLNAALGVQQQCVQERGFILGRKYDFTKRGIKYKINNALEGFGVISFTDIDETYEQECGQALDWLHDVRTLDAATWNPFQPEDKAEMYPNMKNASDFPWHSYKTEIAQSIKEITLMYRCGPKIRNYAHEKGITEWTALTPDAIKYNSGKVLDQIMSFVQMGIKSTIEYDPDAMDEVKQHGFIGKIPCVEFFLDFEAIGNLYDDLSTFPEASSKAMIFLIGVVVVDNVKGTKQYISYLADNLTVTDEKNMVQRMLADFKTTRSEYQQDFSPVYFWSNAENYMLKRAVGNHIVDQENLVMIDLCKCYRDAGLILPGQLGYGLKEVAGIMHKNNMIQTIWSKEGDILDGLGAAIEAIKTYHQGDAESKKKYFKSVIDYNYVDCKVMEEILYYIRKTAQAMPATD
jgi:hypothetical protein